MEKINRKSETNDRGIDIEKLQAERLEQRRERKLRDVEKYKRQYERRGQTR